MFTSPLPPRPVRTRGSGFILFGENFYCSKTVLMTKEKRNVEAGHRGRPDAQRCVSSEREFRDKGGSSLRSQCPLSPEEKRWLPQGLFNPFRRCPHPTLPLPKTFLVFPSDPPKNKGKKKKRNDKEIKELPELVSADGAGVL